MLPSSEYVQKWQAGITWIAQSEWGEVEQGPPAAFGVCAKFFLEPPGRVAKSWPYPTKVPDIDKLLRAVLDSLTHVVYVDDAQVIEVMASKRFASTPDRMGAEITIWRIDDALWIQDPRGD